MRKVHKLLALALGSIVGLTAFAACGGQPTESTGDAPNYRICFDNIADSISLDASVTSVSVADANVIAGYDISGRKVEDWKTIATYEDNTFRAVSAGRVRYQLPDGTTGSVEVVPAYPTLPGNEYSGSSSQYLEVSSDGESVLGHTHDPSIIETRNWKGESIYYIFSTGWADLSDYSTLTTAEDGAVSTQTITTYGNAIHVSYDGMKTWEFIGRTFNYANRDAEVINTQIGDWLYADQIDDTEVTALASWWAPDVVEKPDGSGYWLYTCVVDGGDGATVNDEEGFARACILLYESETLTPGSFTPVKNTDGTPYVLAQSSLKDGPSDRGSVNAIDPQIIYDPNGGMYMAYGSFGSGVYILELDPETGLRKDGKNNWITHEQLREYRDEVAALNTDNTKIGWEHEYYGKNIGNGAMEAPVIARHDNVVMTDEDGKTVEGSGKTYYYSMQSYDGLADNYAMWGGRSESVMGLYTSTQGGIVLNVSAGNSANQGNKYMGGFMWNNVAESNPEITWMLPGHNDLFTSSYGTNVAAYIVRQSGADGNFVSQIHQYYLNSFGDICINPNRYAGETSRAVSAEELFAYTEKAENGAIKLKMAVMLNAADSTNTSYDVNDENVANISRDVYLTREGNASEGTIFDSDGTTELGTWKMYGNGYIRFEFAETLKGANTEWAASSTRSLDSGEKVYYGVVRTAWLSDQNKSGITISCMGRTEGKKTSLAMFMNNYSTISGDGLVGEQYTDAE